MKILTALTASMLVWIQPTIAADLSVNENSPSYSVGLGVSNFGLGLSAAHKTDWHIKSGDQIQIRAIASTIEGDTGGYDTDIAGINYDKIDYDSHAFQLGLDWYPSQSGWTEKIFFSGGALYLDLDSTIYADKGKSYTVGTTQINPSDLTSFQANITREKVTPYVSLGWGNKIQGAPGFDFQAELGVAFIGKADVNVSSSGNKSISAAELEAERKQIIDDTEGPAPFANFTVAYHF
ncbi:hypothetical protein GV054_11945 [Marinomonas mediterranea]|uniref:hypothetical protein n=1 Tax=Marinomonas mediterranea TaxID=119864 RepID=UPI00234B1B66|nr:hypothetical protein [Marinomonas mediterranea]WCN13661.1 hypothetical protein GV054_11945 [Marinomonas mediterranea]